MTHVVGRSPAVAIGLGALLAFPAIGQVSDHSAHHKTRGDETMISTPKSLAVEHHELHEVLAGAARQGGDLGLAAQQLEKVLAPHFRREEEIATPPLGLLHALATGEPTAEMRTVLPMTTALEKELPQMLREHEAIRAAALAFRQAAMSAKRDEFVRFADALAAHARQEEEILYPAAILVGRYVAKAAPTR